MFAVISQFAMRQLVTDFQRVGIFLRHVLCRRQIDQAQIRAYALGADIGREAEAVGEDFFVHDLAVTHDDNEVRHIHRVAGGGRTARQRHGEAQAGADGLMIVRAVRAAFAVACERCDLGVADQTADIGALSVIDELVRCRSRNIEGRAGGREDAGIGFVAAGQTRKRHEGKSRSKQGRGEAPDGWHQLKKLPTKRPGRCDERQSGRYWSYISNSARLGNTMSEQTTFAPSRTDGVEAPKTLRVLLAGPRGFCAGVDRAIRVVEEALRRYGAPVYVRHEIVHNRTVVEGLEAKGAIFVEELDEVPEDGHVVFSAHGVPKAVPAEAQRRNLLYLDATCPLVSKVHREAERHFAGGGPDQRHILMIGHAGHPEVVGTMGQLPPGAVTLINDAEEARTIQPEDPTKLAFITQTTLSVDDTAEIVDILRSRFPLIEGPKREDICYATTNRQEAVKAIAPESDLVIVIGSPNSSNSQRLREVAERSGARRALLVPKLENLDWSVLEGVETLGISAGASAPESLVQEMVTALAEKYTLKIEERIVKEENINFRLPGPLAGEDD